MAKFLVGAVSFCLLAVSVPIFGQSSNASLSGTVTDASNSLIPGVTITRDEYRDRSHFVRADE